MGLPLSLRLHAPPLNFMEFSQFCSVLVRIRHGRHLFLLRLFGVAGAVRVRPLRGRFRGSVHGGGAGRGGAGHPGHVDYHSGFAGFLWEAEESSGYGGEAADCRHHPVCGQGPG
ncbi:unnamed protein product [Cuscuta epithymum]|uniref:Uncharacterized protein n=1 Tax=Cuscuta epithymum TaxID=186058 RepID=A0AAV0GGL4_9ASTE|nr:unnamed protein product [Cuscuta epithymum]